ncbi:MAG: hypothetical protein GF398_07735 [Chitinivibrionales bacterium]|nr:hypothetical protein [Chitinivibrionales bacterium]
MRSIACHISLFCTTQRFHSAIKPEDCLMKMQSVHGFVTGMAYITLAAMALFAADRQNAILEKELIFQPQDFHIENNWEPGKMNRMCHAATIAEAKNKSLVCVFYAGSGEGNSDQQLWVCYKPPGGDWTFPRRLTNWQRAVFNPVIFQPRRNPDAPLLLYFRLTSWAGNGQVLYSDDNGQTWYEPPNGQKYADWNDQPKNTQWGTDLPALPSGHCLKVTNFGGPDKAIPLEMPDGSLLFGSGQSADSRWKFNIEQTDGTNYHGGNWKWNSVCDPGTQPTFLVLSEDSMQLKVLMRAASSPYASTDGGKTWKPSAGQPDNGGAAMAALTLDNGWHACAHTPQQRARIQISISQDGAQWEKAVTVEDDGQRQSYPFMAPGTDGKLHLVWSWHESRGGDAPGTSSIGYARIDPDILAGLPATSSSRNVLQSASSNQLSIRGGTDGFTRLAYNVASPGHVRIMLYDVNGKLKSRLVDQHHVSGNFDVNFDATPLASRGMAVVVFEYEGKVSFVKQIVF